MPTTSTLTRVKRVFKYNSLKLDDIEGMDPEEVKDFYSNIYPQLTQAEIEGPELKDNAEVYEFRKAVGTKGLTVKALAAGKGLPKADGLVTRNIGFMNDVASAIVRAHSYDDDGEISSSVILPPSELLEVI